MSQHNADTLFEQAEELADQEKWPEALTACDAAIDAKTTYLADAYNLRGIILEELGRESEAISAYEMALEIDPDFIEAAENLMALEEDVGDFELAMLELVTVALVGHSPEAHVIKGRLEAEGIRAFVFDDTVASYLWPNLVGGVKVKVEAKDLAAARKVLGDKPEDIEWDEED